MWAKYFCTMKGCLGIYEYGSFKKMRNIKDGSKIDGRILHKYSVAQKEE